jgi:hypothetical protein
MKHIKTVDEQRRALDILEEAFLQVPGVMWLFSSAQDKRKCLRTLLRLCFQETSERQGAYLTSDQNGVVFFYHLKKRPNRIFQFFRNAYLALAIIGLRHSLCVLRTRRIINSVRPRNGWYGWFLATDPKANDTRAGYEIKQDIFRIADQTNESIYVETTLRRTMVLYTKIGFYEYARRKHPYDDFTIWFMRRDPHTGN